MVWAELADMAMTEARVDKAVHWLTDTELMTWLSQARHELQRATNVLKLSSTFTLDPNSADGSYSFPADYKQSVDARYQAGATLDFKPVSRVPYAVYQDIVHAANVASPLVLGSNAYPQSGAKLYLAEAYGKFWVYPFAGATGMLTVIYEPFCTPYSPSDTINWAGYGAEPYAAMQAHGPEREFQDCIMEIKDFCLAHILQKKPLRTKSDEAAIMEAFSRYAEGEQKLRRTNTDYINQVQAPHYLGPVL